MYGDHAVCIYCIYLHKCQFKHKQAIHILINFPTIVWHVKLYGCAAPCLVIVCWQQRESEIQHS